MRMVVNAIIVVWLWWAWICDHNWQCVYHNWTWSLIEMAGYLVDNLLFAFTYSPCTWILTKIHSCLWVCLNLQSFVFYYASSHHIFVYKLSYYNIYNVSFYVIDQWTNLAFYALIINHCDAFFVEITTP